MSDRKPLVLIVDDTPANIHIVSQVLQTEYELQIATDGPTALEVANAQEKPDLILLDIMMPGMDGYEICRRLKDSESTRNIPIIFLTAKSDARDEEYGFTLGAVDYITKPFAVPIVKARVRSHVQLKLKSDLLESLAELDPLTGLYNRRRFDAALVSEWKRAARNCTPLSLVLIDVDAFKQYNDRYGHGAGDDCLCSVARELHNVTRRPGDLAARFGGEEFVILLPSTNAAGARSVAESYRRRVEALDIPHEASDSGDCVTISAGCATVVPSWDDDPAQLVKIADRHLYQAKGEGRNCVR